MRSRNKSGNLNEAIFDSPQVVTSYATTSGLSDAETVLFDRFVPPGSRILDLGVGTGRTTSRLAEDADRYLGIDLSPNMISAARDLHPGVSFCVGDAADLSHMTDASFSIVVFSYNGLDYLVPRLLREQALAEIRRVLEPGGTFIFSTHDPRALIRARNPELGRRGWPVAWLQTARQISRRLPSRAFWAGEGLVLDPVRGGLTTYMSTRSRTLHHLESLGFTHQMSLPSKHPRPARALGTDWWYHAFSRPAAG